MTQLIFHLLTNFSHLFLGVLFSSDVNFAWLTFKFTFLQIIHLTIPSKLVCAPPHPPWIIRSFLSRIKRCNFLFKHDKSSNSPLHWSSYRSFRNETLSAFVMLLSPTARLIMCADDILLFQPYNSISDFSLIQSNIDSISSWISSCSLTINSSKTKYMFLSLRSSSCFASLPSLV